jgi:hypothetical protein
LEKGGEGGFKKREIENIHFRLSVSVMLACPASFFKKDSLLGESPEATRQAGMTDNVVLPMNPLVNNS